MLSEGHKSQKNNVVWFYLYKFHIISKTYFLSMCAPKGDSKSKIQVQILSWNMEQLIFKSFWPMTTANMVKSNSVLGKERKIAMGK